MKKNVLVKNYENGGLKMIKIKTSMKLFWIRHLISTNRGLNNFIPNFIEDRLTSCGNKTYKKCMPLIILKDNRCSKYYLFSWERNVRARF